MFIYHNKNRMITMKSHSFETFGKCQRKERHLNSQSSFYLFIYCVILSVFEENHSNSGVRTDEEFEQKGKRETQTLVSKTNCVL